MNQYQRIVSYLYHYKDGQKGENAGYVRMEQRGDNCRITLQMRCHLIQPPPVIYFFRQKEQEMECLSAGKLTPAGGGYQCRMEMKMDDIMGSKSLEELDGMIIYKDPGEYFATTWKELHIDPSNMKIYSEKSEIAESETLESSADAVSEKPIVEMAEEESKDISNEIEEEEKDEVSSGELPQDSHVEAASEPAGEKENDELQAQSVCAGCQVKKGDYGKRILNMFPEMYPFADSEIRKCVRIEPKDIGCLPIGAWSLAGNRFLMHGYYCYRHLIFTEKEPGRYSVGVPGIYNKKNREQAEIFGFKDFAPLSKQENQHGSFGYWMYELS